jgi:malate synthase
MDRRFLAAYSRLLVRTCHRRGAFALGGMAAQIPIKGDDAANAAALAKVRADKRREAERGHDGTWVAHPGLVALAREELAGVMDGPNQLDFIDDGEEITAADLLAVPAGTCTADGLRTNLSVGLRYLAAWLTGSGCVPIDGLMEDAATAEISRSQLWQWIRHGALLEDGCRTNLELVRDELAGVLSDLRFRLGEHAFQSGCFARAGMLFDEMLAAPELPDFLTLRAYELL